MVGGCVALQPFSVVPFGFRSYWDLGGVVPKGFGTKRLRTGLNNGLKYGDLQA